MEQKEISQEVNTKLYDISLNLNQLRSLAHKNRSSELANRIISSLSKDKHVIDEILNEIDK